MPIPLHIHQAQKESPKARQILESQLQALVEERSRLVKKKFQQRQQLNQLQDELHEWKEQDEIDSQASKLVLQNVLKEWDEKERDIRRVKEEWEQLRKNHPVTFRRTHTASSTRNQHVEERNNTRFYETRLEQQLGGGNSHQRRSSQPSLSDYLKSSSSVSRTTTSLVSVVSEQQQSQASTAPLFSTRFLTSLTAEEESRRNEHEHTSSDEHNPSMSLEQQGSPRHKKQRQGSWQGIRQLLLDSLDEETS